MPNLLLTNYCNRECTYCFAKGKISFSGMERKPAHISLDDLDKVIAFMKASNLKVFSLLGGEPTLHPEFIQIITKILGEGFSIKLFTNGMMPEKVLDFLASLPEDQKNKIGIILNINNPGDTPENEMILQEKTMKTLNKCISLSYNIYKVELDYSFLLETIRKFDLKKNIRLGLAQPLNDNSNSFVNPDDYPIVGTKIATFSDACNLDNVVLGFDCGFVLCMFDKEQLGRMYLNNVNIGFICGSVIDIGPDLNVWNCFPLSNSWNVRLEDYKNEEDLKSYFDDHYKAFRRFGIKDDCFKCNYLQRGQCKGGCIALKIKTFNNYPYEIQRN